MDNTSAVVSVQQIVDLAIQLRASDVHLEQIPEGVRVRYRCDGLLFDMLSIPAGHASRVISRIKVLAQLDIAEKRIPQDGAFNVTDALDIRVATFPARHGEKLVLRLLDRAQGIISLDGLGLSESMLASVLEIVRRSQGLVIVTGPTGCGKTTTLYSLLLTLSSSEKNIVTLEDPVEYTIPGATQAQIRTDIGFGFSEGIRAVLRQDPDIIMVGEIRDVETARAAIRAALTGHLVLTTMHTIDALGALTRLIDMGIEPFLLNAVLTGIIAQRLVRVVCSCSKIAEVEPEASSAGVQRGYVLVGCKRCNGSGYRGRMGIFEIAKITSDIRHGISHHKTYEELHLLAQSGGMQTLWADGVAKINAGRTTWHELLRVLS